MKATPFACLASHKIPPPSIEWCGVVGRVQSVCGGSLFLLLLHSHFSPTSVDSAHRLQSMRGKVCPSLIFSRAVGVCTVGPEAPLPLFWEFNTGHLLCSSHNGHAWGSFTLPKSCHVCLIHSLMYCSFVDISRLRTSWLKNYFGAQDPEHNI